MIKTATIITTNSSENEVGIFDKIEVEFEEDGTTEIMQLSTTMRNDPSQNIVSKDSPFGVAVMGKKVGDRILIKVNPEYSYYIKIKSITKATGDDVDLPII
jgi:transcription elongation factor GreA